MASRPPAGVVGPTAGARPTCSRRPPCHARHAADSWALADGSRDPFPNNVIPQDRIDPVTNIMRGWWPDPQREGLTRNFTFQPPRNQDFHKWDIRWDHNLTNADNICARWSSQRQVVNNPPRLPPPEFGSLTRGGPYDVTSNNAVVGWNRVWSPLPVSNFRVGWNYIDSDIETHLDIPDNVGSRIGLAGFNQHLRGVSEMTMSPWYPIGTNTFRPNLIQSQTRQFSSDNALPQGDHAIKFGAQLFFTAEIHRQSAAHDGHDHLRRTLHGGVADRPWRRRRPGRLPPGLPARCSDRTPCT